MFTIKHIAVDHFRVPLPLALSDSTHGEITHFGLVTVRLTDEGTALLKNLESREETALEADKVTERLI